jgi:chemotaxis protein methyltransferase CheR
MRDECTAFLQWALPRIGMRWPGFRRVRSQVCKRIGRRIHELELAGYDEYQSYLDSLPEEWTRLDAMCRITISCFWRDRALFEALLADVLPELAAAAVDQGDPPLRCFSCGCASGEEPYSLAIGWHYGLSRRFSGLEIEIVATDTDPHMLDRARRAIYSDGSLRDLPKPWRAAAFEPCDEGHRLVDGLRGGVSWLCQDVREQIPQGPFDLVLCRNLAFTYYDEPLQSTIAERLAAVLRPGGALVVGSHESLPEGNPHFEPWGAHRAVFRRVGEP